MRMRHFMAVCLASLAAYNSIPQSLSACERCRGGNVCNSCKPSDDRGLLDTLDSILMRRRPQLSPVSIPRLPALDGSLYCAVTGRVACRCGAGPGCGCELIEPTCGCELIEPNCGCELQPSGRNGQYGAGTRPLPTPSYQHMGESYSESYSEPYNPTPPIAAEHGRYGPAAPEAFPVAPLPQRHPNEIVPLPDSEVDPFRDESARRIRRIPARAVQHTQSQRDYRRSYDAQARHEAVRMSLSDEATNVQPQMSAGLNYTQRQNLDARGSSRQGAVEPTRIAPERLPEVITAAGQRVLGNEHSRPVASPETNYNYYSRDNANPLRGSSR